MNIPNRLIFKWIGGKSWLKDKLQFNIIEMKNIQNKKTYIEPFVGGLGSFLSLYPKIKHMDTIVLNDLNTTIINTYKSIQNNPTEIIKRLEEIEEDYDNTIVDKSVEKLHKVKDKELIKEKLKNAETFFKEKRKSFNKIKIKNEKSKNEQIEEVVLFLFLQDHCFNGVYRENSKGEYNTPFNWSPKKYNVENKKKIIMEYHNFFNSVNITFKNKNVFDLLKEYEKEKDTFIYLDPPYLNIDEDNEENSSKTTENKYNKDHFGYKEQKQLLEELEKFDSFMFSNHYLPIFEKYFKNCGKSIKLTRKNIMTGKAENRGNDKLEILGIKDK